MNFQATEIETDIRYKEGEEEMKLVIMGKEMLNMYFHQTPPKVKGSEVPFTLPLVNPVTGESLGINFEGFMDLVEEGDVITEYKTSQQAMNQSDADSHLQLTAYSYAYEAIHQKLPKLLRIVDFVKTKKPKVLSLETRRDKKDHLRFFALVSHVLKSIRAGIFFPREGFMCKDCEYAGPCKTWVETASGERLNAARESSALMPVAVVV